MNGRATFPPTGLSAIATTRLLSTADAIAHKSAHYPELRARRSGTKVDDAGHLKVVRNLQ